MSDSFEEILERLTHCDDSDEKTLPSASFDAVRVEAGNIRSDEELDQIRSKTQELSHKIRNFVIEFEGKLDLQTLVLHCLSAIKEQEYFWAPPEMPLPTVFINGDNHYHFGLFILTEIEEFCDPVYVAVLTLHEHVINTPQKY